MVSIAMNAIAGDVPDWKQTFESIIENGNSSAVARLEAVEMLLGRASDPEEMARIFDLVFAENVPKEVKQKLLEKLEGDRSLQLWNKEAIRASAEQKVRAILASEKDYDEKTEKHLRSALKALIRFGKPNARLIQKMSARLKAANRSLEQVQNQLKDQNLGKEKREKLKRIEKKLLKDVKALENRISHYRESEGAHR